MRSVFGRVVAGMELITKIGRLPTDEKDRPLQRVTIAQCGELELRKPAVASKAVRPRSISPNSDTESDRSDAHRKSRKKSPLESDQDASSDDLRLERRRRKKEKRAGHRERKEKRTKAPKEETEEELDARCVLHVVLSC